MKHDWNLQWAKKCTELAETRAQLQEAERELAEVQAKLRELEAECRKTGELATTLAAMTTTPSERAVLDALPSFVEKCRYCSNEVLRIRSYWRTELDWAAAQYVLALRGEKP